MNNIGNSKKNIYKNMLLVFVIAFVSRYAVVENVLAVRHISDNVALLASPAYFAGYDWSEVVSNAGYYGFGFYSLFFWVYRLTDNPIHIYQFYTIIGVVIQSLVAPICYYFLVECLGYRSSKKAVLISVINSYFVAVSASAVYNEIPLSLMVWLIAVMLCKICDIDSEKKGIFKYIVLLATMAAYCLTIHVRSWSIIIAICMAFAVYGFLYKSIKKIWVIIPMGAITCVVAEMSTKMMQEKIWCAGGTDGLKNATIAIGKPGMERIGSICAIVFGQANSFMIFSVGTIGWALLILLFYYFNRFKSRYIQKKEDNREDIYLEKKSILVGLTMLIAFGGTIVAQAISWSYAISSGNTYGYKACFYLRYAMPFVGVIFALSMRIWQEKKYRFDSIKWVWLGAAFCLSVYLFFFLIPEVAKLEVCGTAGMGAAIGYRSFEGVEIENYLKMLIIYWGFLIFAFVCINKKREMLLLTCVCTLLLYQYWYNDYYIDKPVEEDNYTMVDASYEWAKNVEELPEEIYVIDTQERDDHNSYYMFQFFLYDKKIIPRLPDEQLEDAVVFSNSRLDYLDGYQGYKLDDNEYVYVKGKYKNLLYEKSYTLN